MQVSPKISVKKPTIKVVAGNGTAKNGQVIANLRSKRRAARRRMMNLRGESLHIIVDSRFEPFDMIPAIRALANPATIARLTITTLSFNIDNVARLCNAIDAGKVGQVTFVCSNYFAKNTPTAYEFLQRELSEKRGGRCDARRIHTKIILIETTDNRNFVIEGSGNLRSCRSVEQFVITHERQLLEFHRTWIEDYIAGDGD